MKVLLIVLLSLFNQTEVTTYISVGEKEVRPSAFTPISEIDYLEIRSAYWAKVVIECSEEGSYILQGGKANLKKVHFYNQEGKSLGEGNFMRVNLEAGSYIFYLHYPFIDEKDNNLLTIRLVEEISFLKERNTERTYQLAFHSFLAFPLLVAIVLALRTRESVYAYYALYILAIMSFFGYQYGLLGEVISIFNDIPPMWIWFFSFLNATFYLLFSSSFLDLKRFDPFSGKLILIANWFIFIFFLISIFLYVLNIDVQHSVGYKIPFLAIELLLILWFIIRIVKHPSRIKRYYLVGFSILIVEGIAGQILSINQNAAIYNHLFQLGMVVEVFVLALGLSVRIDETQKEKNNAKNALIDQLKVNEELQAKYTNELEDKVRVRTEALSKRNEENEVLLKEVHHRVKNNLQMITSLLSMQQRRLKETTAKNALALTKNRVKSIGLIHEHLYRHDDFSKIDLEEYVEELVFILIDSLYRGSKKANTEIDIKSLEVKIETAIPIGLILNELVTNSIKHAFVNNEHPKLSIRLATVENELVLDVIDNGQGILSTSNTGFGNIIINTLIESHSGILNYPEVNEGLHVQVILKDFNITSS